MSQALFIPVFFIAAGFLVDFKVFRLVKQEPTRAPIAPAALADVPPSAE